MKKKLFNLLESFGFIKTETDKFIFFKFKKDIFVFPKTKLTIQHLCATRHQLDYQGYINKEDFNKKFNLI